MGVADEAVAAEATVPTGRYSVGVLLMGVPWVAIMQRLFGATPLAGIQISHNVKDGLNCLCPAWLQEEEREREVRSISWQQWEYDKLMRQQRPHLHLQQNTNKNTKQNTENKNLPCCWQLASTSSASYLSLSLSLRLWLRIPAAKN